MQSSKFKVKIKSSKLFTFSVAFFLVVVYLITRLFNLTIIPVFCDEAIYIRWAQVMRAVASLRFLPLSDGKQPLFMWLVIPFLKVFTDPLVAGRMLSVLAGFGTMAGVFVLSFLLFKNKRLSFFAALFYLITPFTLFFDRMALVDGLLSFFGVWFFIFSLLLVETLRLDMAMIAGIVLGLALLTKSPAVFFASMLPLSLLVKGSCHCEGFIPEAILKKVIGKEIASYSLAMTLIRATVLSGVVYLFAFAIYNILRLGPEFHMIAIRNKDYVFSIQEVLKHPLAPLIGNLKSAVEWYWILLTPPMFLLGVAGVLLTLKKDFKHSVLLLVWWLVPILVQSAFAKVYTARYILFTVPIFLIFCSYSLSWLNRSDLLTGRTCWLRTTTILIVVFLFLLSQIIFLMSDPQKAWLPANERTGYLEHWTAGYGIKEAADYLKKVAKTQKILVGTEGYFGTLPNGLEMYLEKVPNITIIGLGYPIKEISQKLLDGLKDNQVFLLINDTRFQIKEEWSKKLRLIAAYPKAVDFQTNSRENLLFFEIVK